MYSKGGRKSLQAPRRQASKQGNAQVVQITYKGGLAPQELVMNDDHLMRWHARLGRAAALLGSQLDDPPTLDELAAAASVSPYHFHRVWRALTGETIGESTTRMRIEVSKRMLSDRNATVTETAMANGFGTPQSFALAFRRETGVTPTAFARGGAVGDPTASLPAGTVRIELRDAVTVVTLRRVGGAYVALNATFRQVWEWAEAEGRLVHLSGLDGIPLDCACRATTRASSRRRNGWSANGCRGRDASRPTRR